MKNYSFALLLACILTGCDELPNNANADVKAEVVSTPALTKPIDISKAKVTEPSEAQRKITAYLLDPESKKDGYIEKQVDAKSMTIQQVFDSLQSKGEQDIAIRCEGGYNPQPPYYDLTFDVFNGEKITNEFAGMDRNTPIHKLCMMKAYEHFNLLKANNEADLKYYIK